MTEMVYAKEWDSTPREIQIAMLKRLLRVHRNVAFAELLDKEPAVAEALNTAHHNSLAKLLPEVTKPANML